MFVEEGQRIDDRYEIISLVGEGGLGALYKATDLNLKRVVALKFLTKLDEETRQRFLREAKVMAQLTHPNIVEIYRFGQYRNVAYIAMAFIEGVDLKKLIQDKECLSWPDAARICMQVCSGLQLLHRHGIVHRDIKPNNILIQENDESFEARLADFGLAGFMDKKSEEGLRLTSTGDLIGSPYYMAPEQCLGKRADQRSDLYALGCVLYECLSGEPPFFADNPVAVLHKHVHEMPASPRTKDDVPNTLHAIIAKCLEKDPARRYQAAEEMHCDLNDVLNGDEPRFARTTTTRKSRPPIPRFWILAGCGAFLVVSALCWEEGITTVAKLTLEQTDGDSAGRIITLSDWLDNTGRYNVADRLALQLETYALSNNKPELLVQSYCHRAQTASRRGDRAGAAALASKGIDVVKRIADGTGGHLPLSNQKFLQSLMPFLIYKRTASGTFQPFYSIRDKCNLETCLVVDRHLIEVATRNHYGPFDQGTLYASYARELEMTGDRKGALDSLRKAVAIRDSYVASHAPEWALATDCALSALVCKEDALAKRLIDEAIAAQSEPHARTSAVKLLILQSKGKLGEAKKLVDDISARQFAEVILACRHAFWSFAFSPQAIESVHYFVRDLSDLDIGADKKELLGRLNELKSRPASQ